jgi:ribose/xylose/arabinose/galactoside ABC-type transport system permease subunit
MALSPSRPSKQLGGVQTVSAAVARTAMGAVRRGRASPQLQVLREQMAFVLLFVLVVVASLLSNVFLTPNNIINILYSSATLGIVALGQTLLLISANFDLAVASTVSIAGIAALGVYLAGAPLPIAVLAGIATGVVIGLVNGGLVVRTRASPFLITLGMQVLIYALAQMVTGSQQLFTNDPAFTELGRGRVFGLLPWPVVIFLLLVVITEVVLRFTLFGRYLYALGQNETAARLSGISTSRVKLLAFVLCGGLAGLAGVVLTSRLASTRAGGAAGWEFDSIIAAVLGGTSLFGGVGGTLRTVVGVLVLGILNNLLVLINLPYEAQQIVKGGVFLAVVFLDRLARAR